MMIRFHGSANYYLQDVENFLTDGKSQYELRSGESFQGPIVLFYALLGYLPKLREKTKHEFIDLEENYYVEFLLVMLYSAGVNLERRHSDH